MLFSEPTQTDAGRRLVRAIRPFLFALLVLTVGLTLTGWAWRALERADDRGARERFGHVTTLFLDALDRRQTIHEELLLAGAGLLRVLKGAEVSHWRELYRDLRVAERHPGVLGFGYAPFLTPAERDAHVEWVRGQGFPAYAISPPGERDAYAPITFLEPLDARNGRAHGFDMYSEAVRRAAMERARDTGETAASGRATLIQDVDADAQPGFLLYTPVYRDVSEDGGMAERRAALRGFVYSPVRAADFFTAVVDMFQRDVGRLAAIEVFDGERPAAENRLYASRLDEAQPGARAITRAQDVFGRPWTVRLTALPAFEATIDDRLRRGILGGGVLVSALLAALAGMVALRQEHQLAAARAQDVVARELSHRVKNLLTVIQSIAGRSFTDGRPLAEARHVFAERVDALARVHSALLGAQWTGASLHDLVRGELAPFGGRATLVGPQLVVAPQMAQHLAMALHELATNAVKHGALSTAAGSVRVEWRVLQRDGERRFHFQWSEVGGPPVSPPTREGFGQTLLRRLLGSSIAAKPTIDYAPEGLRYGFECALERVEAPKAKA